MVGSGLCATSSGCPGGRNPLKTAKNLLYTIQKANLVNRRGAVSAERRRLIIATINRVNGWVGS